VTITHPFHPLSGQRLQVLYTKWVASTRMYVAGTGQRGLAIPESWTDRIPPSPAAGGATPQLLDPRVLDDLVHLMEILKKSLTTKEKRGNFLPA
jgi:hypothetical protein